MFDCKVFYFIFLQGDERLKIQWNVISISLFAIYPSFRYIFSAFCVVSLQYCDLKTSQDTPSCSYSQYIIRKRKRGIDNNMLQDMTSSVTKYCVSLFPGPSFINDTFTQATSQEQKRKERKRQEQDNPYIFDIQNLSLPDCSAIFTSHMNFKQGNLMQ